MPSNRREWPSDWRERPSDQRARPSDEWEPPSVTHVSALLRARDDQGRSVSPPEVAAARARLRVAEAAWRLAAVRLEVSGAFDGLRATELKAALISSGRKIAGTPSKTSLAHTVADLIVAHERSDADTTLAVVVERGILQDARPPRGAALVGAVIEVRDDGRLGATKRATVAEYRGDGLSRVVYGDGSFDWLDLDSFEYFVYGADGVARAPTWEDRPKGVPPHGANGLQMAWSHARGVWRSTADANETRLPKSRATAKTKKPEAAAEVTVAVRLVSRRRDTVADARPVRAALDGWTRLQEAATRRALRFVGDAGASPPGACVYSPSDFAALGLSALEAALHDARPGDTVLVGTGGGPAVAGHFLGEAKSFVIRDVDVVAQSGAERPRITFDVPVEVQDRCRLAGLDVTLAKSVSSQALECDFLKVDRGALLEVDGCAVRCRVRGSTPGLRVCGDAVLRESTFTAHSTGAIVDCGASLALVRSTISVEVPPAERAAAICVNLDGADAAVAPARPRVVIDAQSAVVAGPDGATAAVAVYAGPLTFLEPPPAPRAASFDKSSVAACSRDSRVRVLLLGARHDAPGCLLKRLPTVLLARICALALPAAAVVVDLCADWRAKATHAAAAHNARAQRAAPLLAAFRGRVVIAEAGARVAPNVEHDDVASPRTWILPLKWGAAARRQRENVDGPTRDDVGDVDDAPREMLGGAPREDDAPCGPNRLAELEIPGTIRLPLPRVVCVEKCERHGCPFIAVRDSPSAAVWRACCFSEAYGPGLTRHAECLRGQLTQRVHLVCNDAALFGEAWALGLWAGEKPEAWRGEACPACGAPSTGLVDGSARPLRDGGEASALVRLLPMHLYVQMTQPDELHDAQIRICARGHLWGSATSYSEAEPEYDSEEGDWAGFGWGDGEADY
ncbi:hypothetical protein M885DRAFT_558991 [Pelagophyceae sp. CCMP2097]|nr:hypothetical protein M885DRAFT_558991 [Pelagophyceae sp. CCMP2097]